MAPESVTFRRHDHLVSVLFGDLLSHSYNITFSMFLYLVNFLLVDMHFYSTSVQVCCMTTKGSTRINMYVWGTAGVENIIR